MLNEDEERELSALMQEMQLTDFQRRQKRLETARQRLQALVELQGEGGLADALAKVRRGEPLSDDEFIVAHLGFTEAEWLKRPKAVRRIVFGPPPGLAEGSLEGAKCFRRVDGAGPDIWEFWGWDKE